MKCPTNIMFSCVIVPCTAATGISLLSGCGEVSLSPPGIGDGGLQPRLSRTLLQCLPRARYEVGGYVNVRG